MKQRPNAVVDIDPRNAVLPQRGLSAYDALMAEADVVDVQHLIRISQGHGITFLALFGSSARGEARPGSDVDLLVAFDTPKSLPDLVRIQRELSESMGRSVDLLTEGSLSPYMRDGVKADMRVLYDRRS